MNKKIVVKFFHYGKLVGKPQIVSRGEKIKIPKIEPGDVFQSWSI